MQLLLFLNLISTSFYFQSIFFLSFARDVSFYFLSFDLFILLFFYSILEKL